jgi:hypothetical protein
MLMYFCYIHMHVYVYAFKDMHIDMCINLSLPPWYHFQDIPEERSPDSVASGATSEKSSDTALKVVGHLNVHTFGYIYIYIYEYIYIHIYTYVCFEL